MNYTKKPITIQAIQLTIHNFNEVEEFVGGDLGKDKEGNTVIATLEGAMICSIGDYIIKGIKGEFYPCKPDIFEITYIKGKGVNYIEQVKEFMTLFGQPVVDTPTMMPEDRNRLRIALIFEELKEYAEASGLLNYFNEALCDFSSTDFATIRNTYKPTVNLTEQLDALEDMQYVLSGAVLENGFGDIFDEGFDEVHRSNMSKACDTFDECEETIVKYRDTDKVEVYGLQKGTKWLIKRKEDDKVLKSINYSPANLQPIIDSKTKFYTNEVKNE